MYIIAIGLIYCFQMTSAYDLSPSSVALRKGRRRQKRTEEDEQKERGTRAASTTNQKWVVTLCNPSIA